MAGEPLLLIHGQMSMSKEDCRRLQNYQTIFTSFNELLRTMENRPKHPGKYQLILLNDDLIDFMRDMIGEKTIFLNIPQVL